MYVMDIGFCYKTASIWHTIGYAFFIVKIVVPLIIIILGIIDFTKAVISNDEKEFIDYSSDFNNCLNCITSPIGKCDTSYAGGIIPDNPGNGDFNNGGGSTTDEKEQAPEPEKEAAPEPEKEPGPIPE